MLSPHQNCVDRGDAEARITLSDWMQQMHADDVDDDDDDAEHDGKMPVSAARRAGGSLSLQTAAARPTRAPMPRRRAADAAGVGSTWSRETTDLGDSDRCSLRTTPV